MKKRLGALILAMLMILSICPVAMAEDAVAPEVTSTASAYDVRIEGRFEQGKTLTALYEYAPGTDGCDEIPDDAYFTWYKISVVNGNATLIHSGYKSENGHLYTLPAEECGNEQKDYGGKINFFVSVQTKTEKGWGEPVCNGVYGPGLMTGSAGTYARGVHIVPKNPEGTMLLGDTIAVRVSGSSSRTGAYSHSYKWFVKDTPASDAVVTYIDGATSDTYVIGPEAFGKFIGCEVTVIDGPYKGTAVSFVHYGDLGVGNDVVASIKPYNSNTDSAWEPYPLKKLLSDGMSKHGASAYSNFYAHEAATREIVYDMGSTVEFDGLYFSLWGTNSVNSLEVRCSDDNVVWSEPIITTGTAVSGDNQYLLDTTARTHYLKVTISAPGKVLISECYPFKKQDAKVTVSESVAAIENGTIKVKELNKSAAALLSEITATSLIDDSALTPIYVDADGNKINEDFAINGDTTAKLQVTGKNGVKLEYALSFQKLEENLEVTCTPGVAYLEEGKIYVDTWKTSSSDLVKAVSAVSAVDGSTLTPVVVDAAGNESEAFDIDETTTGKYIRFTNLYGDNYDYEIAYKPLVHNNMQYLGNASYVWGAVDFSKYNKEVTYNEETITVPGGKYVLKSDVYIPDGYTVSLQARQGTSLQGGWISGMLKFDDVTKTILVADIDTGFKYVPGKTYTIEFLIDYDDLKLSNLYEVYTETRVDGIVIAKGARTIQRAATVGMMSAYFSATKADESATGNPKATNSIFRKVASRDAFAVTNNYALNLKSGDSIVTDIEPGVAYTFDKAMSVYPANGLFVAIYNADKTLDSVALEPATVTIKEGQVVKAFCLAPATLKPLLANGEWK